MTIPPLEIFCLGQAGFRFKYAGTVAIIDPYLSNSVQEQESEVLVRLKQIPIQPSDITDIDWILITHEHRDHCDIETLLPISQANDTCCFIGPPNVVWLLKNAGINAKRIRLAEPGISIRLNTSWKVFPVPSAHPNLEYDAQGRSRWLGYIMQIANTTIYHAGDTSVDQKIIQTVKKYDVINLAFLPVNERNYFLDHRGIIGNMSIRESFKFAEKIGAQIVVPIHWDMFEINSVFKEEIEFLYERISPEFELSLEPNLRF